MSHLLLRQDKLSNQEFRFIRELVYERTGIFLKESKRNMVCRRLMRRKKELNLDQLQQYCEILREQEEKELPHLINAITTNLTHFFREQHHFQYLSDFIKELMQQPGNYRLRLWSAGCSTGEEAYSLAMTLCETMGSEIEKWDAKILATDLDTNVLVTAQQGVYSSESCQSIPAPLHTRWFQREPPPHPGLFKVKPELQQLTYFKPLNLKGPWPMQGPFDVIMCRNVMIYFDRPTQKALIHRFIDLLRPGGILCLGHSESMGNDMADLIPVGRTLYQKRGVKNIKNPKKYPNSHAV